TWAPGNQPLPPGLGLNAAGVISGTPTLAGVFSFIVQVGDSHSPQQFASRSVTIRVGNPLQVNPITLPAGQVGSNYNAQLASTGGITPVTWGLASGSGPLPGGMGISTAGLISGIPSATGTFNFTVQATDSSSPAQTATRNLSIVVTQSVSFVTTTLPDGV